MLPKISNSFLSAGLIVMAAIPALLFGSARYWSVAISGTLAVALFMYGVFSFNPSRDGNPGKEQGLKFIVYAALALVVYLVFQMVPLPVSVLAPLHPRLASLIELGQGASPATHSITVYPFQTETALARLIVYLMVFFTAAFFLRGRRAVFRVLKGLSIFGFALSLFAIVQHVTWNGKIYWLCSYTPGGSPFGPFVDRDHFPGYMNMIVPLTLGVALASKEIGKKVLYAFFAVVMTLAVFLSLSRGGVISFICGLAVFSAILVVRRGPKWQFMVLALFAIALVSFVLYAGASPLIARFKADQISDEGRLLAWKGTLAAFRDFPVFGAGFGTFENVFALYQPAGLQKIWEHAHNDYLELLLEGGLVGVLIAGVFIYAVLKRAFRGRGGWQGDAAYLKAGFIASIVTISVHSIFDFNLHVPSNAILLSIILGLAVSGASKFEI